MSSTWVVIPSSGGLHNLCLTTFGKWPASLPPVADIAVGHGYEFHRMTQRRPLRARTTHASSQSSGCAPKAMIRSLRSCAPARIKMRRSAKVKILFIRTFLTSIEQISPISRISRRYPSARSVESLCSSICALKRKNPNKLTVRNQCPNPSS